MSDQEQPADLSLREKAAAITQVISYRPGTIAGIVVLSLVAAILEGIGLSFLVPVIEMARSGPENEALSGIGQIFVDAYSFVGVPFSLETVLLGLTVVMVLRYTSSFAVIWLRASLELGYVRQLQSRAYRNALDAEVSYFDAQGSDNILNAIVTQSKYAGEVIRRITSVIQQGFLTLMYLGIALYLAPLLTIGAGLLLGFLTYLLRSALESSYTVGDRVADANERIQQSVQAGMQGIRDVKLFGLHGELYGRFKSAVDEMYDSTVRLQRNQAALDNLYQLLTALTLFGLIYAALQVLSLSLASLGVFLFAVFRLAPRVSTLNNHYYRIEGELPHVIRTRNFIEELESRQEPTGGSIPVPDSIEGITFDDVSFAYDSGEQIFNGLSLSFGRDEFTAFVGPSGAGKSSIVSLLTRMYPPTSGEIRANGHPIDEFDIETWRERVSVVRQQPFIFNDTLRRNVTIGNRDATQPEIDRVCEIAQVTEFLEDLPNGYQTVLGDKGVRLSGGQKQRVAIARALLKDADLLVLDEATSDLDSNIEEQVHDAIESMDRDYAILVIAHRLTTVINADCIYILDDGEIVETGQHEELLQNGGIYADLYATQTQQV